MQVRDTTRALILPGITVCKARWTALRSIDGFQPALWQTSEAANVGRKTLLGEDSGQAQTGQ